MSSHIGTAIGTGIGVFVGLKFGGVGVIILCVTAAALIIGIYALDRHYK